MENKINQQPLTLMPLLRSRRIIYLKYSSDATRIIF